MTVRPSYADLIARSAERINAVGEVVTYTTKSGQSMQLRAMIRTEYAQVVDQESGSVSMNDVGISARIRLAVHPDPNDCYGDIITQANGSSWVVVDARESESAWLLMKLNTKA